MTNSTESSEETLNRKLHSHLTYEPLVREDTLFLVEYAVNSVNRHK